MKEKIIGFFRYSETDFIDKTFQPYIYGDSGVSTLIDRQLKDNYGIGLDLILFSWICYDRDSDVVPILRPVSNYNKSERSISVKVNVTYNNFFDRGEEGRRRFVIERITEGLYLVKNKLKKNKEVNIEFDLLISDFTQLSGVFLGSTR